MANLDKELDKARKRVERLKERKRVAEKKHRARVAETIMSVLAEIVNNENENVDQVSVRTLINRAQAKINEQNTKRKEAARKAAASRRKAKSVTSNESSSQPG